MSYTAIWRNRNKPVKCSSGECVCSTTSGGDDPPGMVRYTSFRVIRDRKRGQYTLQTTGATCWHTQHLQPPEYNQLMTKEQADALDIEHGRSVPYARNYITFVMSRAARRRGYTTQDWMYHRRRQKHAND